jgi:hypothetical protein
MRENFSSAPPAVTALQRRPCTRLTISRGTINLDYSAISLIDVTSPHFGQRPRKKMAIYAQLSDLLTESDVEQKIVWPLLTSQEPFGLGFSASDIFTKPNLVALTIDKGHAEKVYFPDYVVVLSGLPVVVVEAKLPGDDLDEALRQARLYAAELNNHHPSGLNPCCRIVASDGGRILSSPADSVQIDLSLALSDLNAASEPFHRFRSALNREVIQRHADALSRQLQPVRFQRPLNLLGGKTARNEEVGSNTFGSNLSLEFVHLFKPRTRA